MANATLVRAGLWVLAVPTLGTGAWALLAPSSWYADYSGGIAPPSAFGAYNEHFVQDLGGGYLAVGVLLVWAAVALRRDLVRAALAANLVFNVPHLVVHLMEDGDLDRTGYWFVNGLLGFVVVLSVWLWWSASRLRSPDGTHR